MSHGWITPDAAKLLARPSCRERTYRLSEALSGRDELGGRELREILVHGKRVRPAWYLGGERFLPRGLESEHAAMGRGGICTRGTGMLVSTRTFGAIDATGRERCIVSAGQTRVRPDHWLAREYAHSFRAADPDDETTAEALCELVMRSKSGQKALALHPRLPGPEAWRL